MPEGKPTARLAKLVAPFCDRFTQQAFKCNLVNIVLGVIAFAPVFGELLLVLVVAGRSYQSIRK